jgi:5-methylcytosine-specific restriction enzyme A
VEKGFCQRHEAAREAAMGALRQRYDERRGTSSERGYDAAWRRFRHWFMQQPENVMCADCRQEFTQEVHHLKKVRDFPELRLDPVNCRGLCKACHSARTLAGE